MCRPAYLGEGGLLGVATLVVGRRWAAGVCRASGRRGSVASIGRLVVAGMGHGLLLLRWGKAGAS